VPPKVIKSPISVDTAVGVLFHLRPPCISIDPVFIEALIGVNTISPNGFTIEDVT